VRPFCAVGPSIVSSPLIQDPQGVGPPAQLRIVPAMLPQALTNLPEKVSNSRVVVPPPALES
jgi:hypothetical protein